MFSVARIHLISPHPFLPLGEGIGVRDIDAEFAEEPWYEAPIGLVLLFNARPDYLWVLCASAVSGSLLGLGLGFTSRTSSLCVPGAGDHLRTSDVDLVVISPDFASMPFLRRIREVVALWESDLDLEVLPYTPEEFERKKEEIGIVAVAAREGVEIEL